MHRMQFWNVYSAVEALTEAHDVSREFLKSVSVLKTYPVIYHPPIWYFSGSLGASAA